VRRENFDTAHRKVDGIKMNIKVPYRLAIFAIIIEILIFEIVLMRARREKRSSRSRYSPAQFIKHWLWAGRWRDKRGGVPGAEQRIIANIAKRYATFMFILIPSTFLCTVSKFSRRTLYKGVTNIGSERKRVAI